MFESDLTSAFLGAFPGSDGNPAFDRFVLQETDGSISVVWRNHHKKGVQLLLRNEGRPAAKIVPGVKTITSGGLKHVLFAHSPMGFSDKVKGDLEKAEQTALRETREDVGRVNVLDVCSPSDLIPGAFDSIYMNPTCCESPSSRIVFMQISGEPGTPSADRHEIGKHFNWLTMKELEKAKAIGFTSSGACIRQGPFMAALAAFEGCLPLLRARDRKRQESLKAEK